MLELGRFQQLQENMLNDPQYAKDMRAVMWAGSLHLKSAKLIKKKRATREIKIKISKQAEQLRNF